MQNSFSFSVSKTVNRTHYPCLFVFHFILERKFVDRDASSKVVLSCFSPFHIERTGGQSTPLISHLASVYSLALKRTDLQCVDFSASVNS